MLPFNPSRACTTRQLLPMKLNDLFAKRIPKQFCVIEVVRNIVGQAYFASDKDDDNAAFLVRQSNEPGFSPPSTVHEDWMKELGLPPLISRGTLYVPPHESRCASHIAMAAHEAIHAWLYLNGKGEVWRSEEITNQLAELWLRQHLSGMRLHVALEAITQSRISYAIH